MTQDGFPAASLRVGHAERDAVAAILQEAAADGRLGMEELDERLDAALRAKTYGDLEPLVADLSADLPWRPRQWPVEPPMPAYGPPPPGFSREDPLRLDGGMSSAKRVGAWTVPPFLRISSGAGSVKLDCLQATAAAPVIEVEVIAGAGSVVIIVPDGWAANDDRLGNAWGTKRIKVPRTPAPGHPLLVLYGSVGLGSFKVRPPLPQGAAQARSCGSGLIAWVCTASTVDRRRLRRWRQPDTSTDEVLRRALAFLSAVWVCSVAMQHILPTSSKPRR